MRPARLSALLAVVCLAAASAASALGGQSCPNQVQDPAEACITKATVDTLSRTLTLTAYLAGTLLVSLTAGHLAPATAVRTGLVQS